MIRCDIHKGKLRFGNFIEAGRDAQPRKDEGLVVDHGNVGKYYDLPLLTFTIYTIKTLIYTYRNFVHRIYT